MKRNHLVTMLAGGAVLLVVLLAAGVPLANALPYAAILACPLMMIGMMWAMNRNGGGHGAHGGTCCGQHDHQNERVTAAPGPAGPAADDRPPSASPARPTADDRLPSASATRPAAHDRRPSTSATVRDWI